MVRYPLLAIASQLKEARRRSGKSQRDLVDGTAIGKTQLVRVEAGQDVRASTLIEILRLAGLELVVVPRDMVPLVTSITKGEKPSKPLYAVEEDDDA